MPWTGSSFRKKHNHGLSDAQASKASETANAILRDTGDEAKAIKIANWQAKSKVGRYNALRQKGPG